MPWKGGEDVVADGSAVILPVGWVRVGGGSFLGGRWKGCGCETGDGTEQLTYGLGYRRGPARGAPPEVGGLGEGRALGWTKVGSKFFPR